MNSEFLPFLDIAINGKTIEILEALEKGDFSSVKGRYPKSTLYHSISKLKTAKLLEKRKDGYCLTHAGNVYLKMLRKFCRCMAKFHEVSEAFPDHTVDFPEEFVMRIDELEDPEIIMAESTDILRPMKVLMDLLVRSREIKAISPLFYPDYPNTFRKIIRKVDFIELIVKEDIWNRIKMYDHIIDYSDKFKVFVTKKVPNLTLIVSDIFLSMNFYRKSGEYDFWRTMISESESAIRFGRDLFEFYKSKSERVL